MDALLKQFEQDVPRCVKTWGLSVKGWIFCVYSRVMSKISFWFNNARHISLPQSMLPTITAVAVAAASGSFHWLEAMLCIVGVIFAHLGMNLADDWFDYRVQSAEMRQKHAADGIRARMVKYPYLTSGQATTGELLAVICIFLCIATACGVAVAFLVGWDILWFVLAGAVIGISYSGGPLRLGFRGLGELVIFLMFGPLLMTGVYFACTGTISPNILLISTAVGLLVTNIVYSHSVMDAEHDIKAGKYTMAHLMGSRTGQIVLSGIFNVVPYLLIIIGVVFGWLHWAYLFSLVMFPVSLWLVRSLSDFVKNRPVEIVIKPWMGPMGDFAKYKAAGIDWFMLRWLTARNIVSLFCFIIVIVNIVLAIVK